MSDRSRSRFLVPVLAATIVFGSGSCATPDGNSKSGSAAAAAAPARGHLLVAPALSWLAQDEALLPAITTQTRSRLDASTLASAIGLPAKEFVNETFLDAAELDCAVGSDKFFLYVAGFANADAASTLYSALVRRGETLASQGRPAGAHIAAFR